jgi:hypothetical protein
MTKGTTHRQHEPDQPAQVHIINGSYADAELRALSDCGIRARFSYGYSRALQTKPERQAFLGAQGDMWATQPDMAMALLGAVLELATLGKCMTHSFATCDDYGEPEPFTRQYDA